jgi:hypothetical protein
MDVTPYVEALREDLVVAAEAGGPQARDLAQRLTAALESAVRLALLDALSAAAAEITRDLAPGSVELRLRGREPSFVVVPPPDDEPVGSFGSLGSVGEAALPVPASAADGEEGAMARINVRLGEQLKGRIEEAAGRAGLSVNAWLVRAASAALDPQGRAGTDRLLPRGAARYTGWVR